MVWIQAGARSHIIGKSSFSPSSYGASIRCSQASFQGALILEISCSLLLGSHIQTLSAVLARPLPPIQSWCDVPQIPAATDALLLEDTSTPSVSRMRNCSLSQGSQGFHVLVRVSGALRIANTVGASTLQMVWSHIWRCHNTRYF